MKKNGVKGKKRIECFFRSYILDTHGSCKEGGFSLMRRNYDASSWMFQATSQRTASTCVLVCVCVCVWVGLLELGSAYLRCTMHSLSLPTRPSRARQRRIPRYCFFFHAKRKNLHLRSIEWTDQLWQWVKTNADNDSHDNFLQCIVLQILTIVNNYNLEILCF